MYLMSKSVKLEGSLSLILSRLMSNLMDAV